MDEKLFNAILQEDKEEVIGLMILPQSHYGSYGSTPYEVNLEAEAIDVKNLVVRTDRFIDTMCEFDEFSLWVNRIIYLINQRDREDLWDYQVQEELSKLGIEIEVIQSDYTYNNPDYCRLDRDIHYTIFKYESEYYVVFSVHHGADARIGFGEIVCFKLTDVDYFNSAMLIEATLDEEGNEEVRFFDIEDIATYSEEDNEWIHNETGKPIYLRSSAEGF